MAGRTRARPKASNVYDVDAAAFFARVTTYLNATDRNAINAFIAGLKTDGLWSGIDVLQIYWLGTQQSGLLNMRQNLYNGTVTGSPTFTPYQGFLTNGTSSYIDTGFNPSTASSPNFTATSAGIRYYDYTKGGPSGDGGGLTLGSGAKTYYNDDNYEDYGSGTLGQRASLNGAVTDVTTTGDFSSSGFLAFDLTGSGTNAMAGYKNGVARTNTGSVAPSGLDSGSITLGKSGSTYGKFNGGFFCAGRGFTAAEELTFYNRMRTFATAMGIAGSVGPAQTAPAIPRLLRGINFAGLEFSSAPQAPGGIATYLAKGINIGRVPFLWERAQPTMGAVLDPTYMAMIQSVVTQLTAGNAIVLLDMHNYQHRGSDVIGGAVATSAYFADAWGRIATYFLNQNVMFGLMNEPSGSGVTELLVKGSQDAAIAAIKATGHGGTCVRSYLGPYGYSGAHDVTLALYGQTLAGLGFPPGSVFDIHFYPDYDHSGRYLTDGSDGDPSHSGDCQIGAQSDMAGAIQVMRANDWKCIFGEFGAKASTNCTTVLTAMMNVMEGYRPTVIGSTQWTGVDANVANSAVMDPYFLRTN